MSALNHGVSVSGTVDTATADSIAALLADARVPQLRPQADPAGDSRAALAAVTAMAATVAPVPFLLAVVVQETGSRHWSVPQHAGEEAGWVRLGLDHDPATPERVRSRGSGLGQHTLFHHPPRPGELTTVLDPVGNVGAAFAALGAKFAALGEPPGPRSGAAEDRAVEHRLLALRPCRYAPGDPRHMRACRGCAAEADKLTLAPDTPLYLGAPQRYRDAQDYPGTTLTGVPNRAGFLCDWPYAVRCYNGGGPDSFAYQARVLRNLLAGSPAEA